MSQGDYLLPVYCNFTLTFAAILAMTFTSDFKLGHYMKVPPRPMFWSQVLATVIAGTVQLGVQAWMFSNITYVSYPLLVLT